MKDHNFGLITKEGSPSNPGLCWLWLAHPLSLIKPQQHPPILPCPTHVAPPINSQSWAQRGSSLTQPRVRHKMESSSSFCLNSFAIVLLSWGSPQMKKHINEPTKLEEKAKKYCPSQATSNLNLATHWHRIGYWKLRNLGKLFLDGDDDDLTCNKLVVDIITVIGENIPTERLQKKFELLHKIQTCVRINNKTSPSFANRFKGAVVRYAVQTEDRFSEQQAVGVSDDPKRKIF